jgi:hypothetical protein
MVEYKRHHPLASLSAVLNGARSKTWWVSAHFCGLVKSSIPNRWWRCNFINIRFCQTILTEKLIKCFVTCRCSWVRRTMMTDVWNITPTCPWPTA